MTSYRWKSESEMAAVLVKDLKRRRWSVFEEVCYGSLSADLVARRGQRFDVFECKTFYTPLVLEQARRWLGHVHARWAVIGREHANLDCVSETCARDGLGLVLITSPEDVREVCKPRLGGIRLLRYPDFRKRLLIDSLNQEHQNGQFMAAGGRFGHRSDRGRNLHLGCGDQWFTGNPPPSIPLAKLEQEILFLAERVGATWRPDPDPGEPERLRLLSKLHSALDERRSRLLMERIRLFLMHDVTLFGAVDGIYRAEVCAAALGIEEDWVLIMRNGHI